MSALLIKIVHSLKDPFSIDPWLLFLSPLMLFPFLFAFSHIA